MRLALALVVALALLAGCASAPTTVKQSSVTPAPTANATDDTAGVNMTGPVARANESGPMPGMFFFKYDGTSPQGVCTTTGTPADSCAVPSTGKESFHVVDYKGQAKHVTFTVTYGALQPGFSMYASVCLGKAGAKVTANDCKNYQTAPSPMKLDVDLGSAAPGTSIALSIGSVAGGPGAIVFGGDAFKVDGHLMAAPQP